MPDNHGGGAAAARHVCARRACRKSSKVRAMLGAVLARQARLAFRGRHVPRTGQPPMTRAVLSLWVTSPTGPQGHRRKPAHRPRAARGVSQARSPRAAASWPDLRRWLPSRPLRAAWHSAFRMHSGIPGLASNCISHISHPSPPCAPGCAMREACMRCL